MSMPIEITDGAGTGKIAHVHKENGDIGVIAFTEPLRPRTARFDFAFNPAFGVEMAIDGSFGGTPDLVYDEDDVSDWTGSNIVGTKATFDSTDGPIGGTAWPPSGTKSTKIDKPNANDVWQFDKGTTLDLSGFVAISMKVIVASNWDLIDSVVIYGWDTNTNTQVGTSVKLEDYFNATSFNVIQGISIPLDDMSLTGETIYAIRMELAIKGTGKAPKFYIDTLQVEETTGSEVFTIEPPAGTKYYIDELRFSFVDGLSTTLLSNSMPNLSYDKILAITKLSTGIGFTQIRDSKLALTGNITCLGDLTRAGATLENVYSDDTNTHVTAVVTFKAPIILDSRLQDSFNIIINDDLSGLESFFGMTTGYTIDV